MGAAHLNVLFWIVRFCLAKGKKDFWWEGLMNLPQRSHIFLAEWESGKIFVVEKIVEKCSSFLNENGLKLGDLQIILNGIDNLAGCFENLNTALLNFKEECGEYPTSGAYALFRGGD